MVASLHHLVPVLLFKAVKEYSRSSQDSTSICVDYVCSVHLCVCSVPHRVCALVLSVCGHATCALSFLIVGTSLDSVDGLLLLLAGPLPCRSPLILAAQNGLTNAVKALLESGADPSIKAQDQTALDFATTNTHLE